MAATSLGDVLQNFNAKAKFPGDLNEDLMDKGLAASRAGNSEKINRFFAAFLSGRFVTGLKADHGIPLWLAREVSEPRS